MKTTVFVMIVLAAGFLVAADNDAINVRAVGSPDTTPAREPIADLGFSPGEPVPGQENALAGATKSAEGMYGLYGQVLDPGPGHHTDRSEPTKDIDVTEIDFFALYTIGLDFCTGLDYVTHIGDNISCSHPNSDTLYFLDIDTFAIVDSWATDPANMNNFGNTVGYGMYLNDWINTNYFFGNGGAWTAYANPAGVDGRGMDYDWQISDLIWQTHTAGTVYSLIAFPRDTSSGTWYDISAYIPGHMSGLAVFDSEGRTGIAVLCYNHPEIFFFEFDGVDIVFLGSRGLPWSAVTVASLGLGYSTGTGLFYYSFIDTIGNGFISRLRIDLRAIFQDDFERGDVVDWACDGQCIGGYTFDCDPVYPCACFTTTEGYGVCIDDFACSNPQCNSSADCRPGFVCITCSNCPTDVCARRQCTDGWLPDLPPDGMTGSGR